MKTQEARRLVDGLAAMADFEGFDENDHAFLQEIAGPYPFYLQVAGYLLFEEKRKIANLTAREYSRVKREFAEETQGHFQYMWGHLNSDERKALRLISEGRLDEVTEKNMERLGQKCVVYQGAIFSSSFAEFVQRQTPETLDSSQP